MAFQVLKTFNRQSDMPWIGVSIKRARANREDLPDHVVSDDMNIALAKEVGAKIVRLDVMWDRCETQKGVYNFQSTTSLIDKAWPQGIRVLPILARGNRLYTGDWKVPPTTPEARQGFAAFSAAASEALGVPYLECMNEPNNAEQWGGPPDPVAYGLLLKESIIAVRSCRKPRPIIAGGLAIGGNGGFIEPKDFIAQAMPHIAPERFLAWGAHPYTGADKFPNDPMLRPDAAQARMLSFRPTGFQEMMFNTEQGFSIADCRGATYAEQLIRQGAYTTWFMLSSLLQWGSIIYYDLIDDGKDPTKIEEGYGLYTFGLQLKPSGRAFKRLASIINSCASAVIGKDGDILRGIFTMENGEIITIDAPPL